MKDLSWATDILYSSLKRWFSNKINPLGRLWQANEENPCTFLILPNALAIWKGYNEIKGNSGQRTRMNPGIFPSYFDKMGKHSISKYVTLQHLKRHLSFITVYEIKLWKMLRTNFKICWKVIWNKKLFPYVHW